jgi:hypothetical protein
VAQNDRFLLKLKTTLSGQAMLNVFGYTQSNVGAGSASDLNTSFESNIIPALKPMLNENLAFIGLSTVNLDDPADFEDVTFTQPDIGSVSGDVYPPYVAYTFRYHRASTVYRNGAKRFAGVPEAASANGVTLATGYPALVAAAATALEADLVEAGNTYRPGIVRKGGGPPLAYIAWGAITGVAFVHFGSQNSRKPF